MNHLRRKINDSGFGQAINNSVPGILFEGITRKVHEGLYWAISYCTAQTIEQVARVDEDIGSALALFCFGAHANYLACKLDPEFCHTSTSMLYREITCKDGALILEDVTLKEALQQKFADISPHALKAFKYLIGERN